MRLPWSLWDWALGVNEIPTEEGRMLALNLPATFELEGEQFHEIAKIALLPDSRSLPEFSFLTSSKNYAIFIAW
jgi:hypothetical protein